MATKIYKDSNYIVIEHDGKYIDISSSDIEIKYIDSLNCYNIYDKQDLETIIVTVFSPGVLKQDGNPYTMPEWRAFYRAIDTSGGGGAVTVNEAPSFFALDKAHNTAQITTGGTAQLVSAINTDRKGFELQNQSSDILMIGFGSTPSLTNGFLLNPGGSYFTGTTVSTKAIYIFGATTGQRFTYIEY